MHFYNVLYVVGYYEKAKIILLFCFALWIHRLYLHGIGSFHDCDINRQTNTIHLVLVCVNLMQFTLSLERLSFSPFFWKKKRMSYLSDCIPYVKNKNNFYIYRIVTCTRTLVDVSLVEKHESSGNRERENQTNTYTLTGTHISIR